MLRSVERFSISAGAKVPGCKRGQRSGVWEKEIVFEGTEGES
jgi:hypothetical protein